MTKTIPMQRTLIYYFLLCFPLLNVAQSNDYHEAMKLGEQATASHHFAQAIQHYGNAIKLAPRDAEAYLRQMEVAIQKRDLSIVKRTIQQLEGLEHSLPLEIYLTYAQLAQKQRLYKDGLAMLSKAEAKYTAQKPLLLQRANLYKKLNDHANVIKTLNQALEKYPRNNDILYQLAVTYIPINRQKSIQLFKKLLSDEQYKDAALSALGLLHTKLYEADPGPNNRSNLILALSYYNSYFQRHPKDQDARNIVENLRILLQE